MARRGAAAGLGGDPVPQALVITGIVVAFAATALAVALLLRLFQETGRASLATRPLGSRQPMADPANIGHAGHHCRRLASGAGGHPAGPGVLLALALGGRWAERIAHATLACAAWSWPLAIAASVWSTGAVQSTSSVAGGLRWAWRSGPTVCRRSMVLASAVLLSAAALFARDEFQAPEGMTEASEAVHLLVAAYSLSSALNAVFLGGDLFSLYVALELLTFAAVPLVSLDGRPRPSAALRYLLFALLGSVLYLLGTALSMAPMARLISSFWPSASGPTPRPGSRPR